MGFVSLNAGNVNTVQLQRVISLGTKQQSMKARNMPVTHVTIRQHKSEARILIKGQAYLSL